MYATHLAALISPCESSLCAELLGLILRTSPAAWGKQGEESTKSNCMGPALEGVSLSNESISSRHNMGTDHVPPISSQADI